MKNNMVLNRKELVGGPGEVRTLDLMTASHARSQLRHRPTEKFDRSLFVARAGGAVNAGCAVFVGKLGDKFKVHTLPERLIPFASVCCRKTVFITM